MPTPHPPNGTIRIVWGGSVSTQDTWTTSLWVTVGELAGRPSPSEMNTYATACLNSMKTNLWTGAHLLPNIAPATTLTGCQVYFYDGTSAGVAVQGSATTTAVPGTGTNVHPAYVSLVASLYTNTAGRSGKGRMYIPLTAMDITAGTLQTSDGALLAPNIKAVIAGCNINVVVDGATLTALPSVYSRKNNVLELITAIRVDSIPDTQHGRVNKDVPTSVTVVSYP